VENIKAPNFGVDTQIRKLKEKAKVYAKMNRILEIVIGLLIGTAIYVILVKIK